MREILFRGKSIDTDEWVFGSFVMDALEQFNGLCGIDGFIRLYDKNKRKMQMYEVDRETVGQYTGLRDRNCKRIFEGDIVRHYNNGLDPGAFEVGAIRWNKNYANFERTSSPSAVRVHNLCRYEIIGNIYDNPELMEEGVG